MNTIITWLSDNIWKPSYTKATAAVYGIPAALYSVGDVISKYANDPTISNYIAQMNVPNWVPVSLAGIALVHYVAAGRN